MIGRFLVKRFVPVMIANPYEFLCKEPADIGSHINATIVSNSCIPYVVISMLLLLATAVYHMWQ